MDGKMDSLVIPEKVHHLFFKNLFNDLCINRRDYIKMNWMNVEKHNRNWSAVLCFIRRPILEVGLISHTMLYSFHSLVSVVFLCCIITQINTHNHWNILLFFKINMPFYSAERLQFCGHKHKFASLWGHYWGYFEDICQKHIIIQKN